jgi:hypothetical protein
VYIIKDIVVSKEALDRLKALRIEMLDIEKKLQNEKNTDYIPYKLYDLSVLPIHNSENLDTDLLSKLALYRLQERELLNKILPEYYT